MRAAPSSARRKISAAMLSGRVAICSQRKRQIYPRIYSPSGEATRHARWRFASIDDASGSFPAVPLQHFAATIAKENPRTAARLLGYVDNVFDANAFSREYTERYTYERLTATLQEALDDEEVESYRREGALLSVEQALRLARGINEHS